MNRLKAPKDNNWFGRRLRAAREAAGLSQEGLAERVDITRLTIARYESGKLKPSFDRLEPIASAVSQPLSWFFASDELEPVPPAQDFSKELIQEILLRLTLLEDRVAQQVEGHQDASPSVNAREKTAPSYCDDLQEGIRRGRQYGLQEGLAVLRGSILEILEARFQEVPDIAVARLESTRDGTRLRALLREAATASTLDRFLATLHAEPGY